MARKRMKPEDRFEQLITYAFRIAILEHYKLVTADQIAKAANCSRSLVSHYLGTKATFEATILREALRRGNPKVIKQAMNMGDIRFHDRKLSDRLAEVPYMTVE